MFRKKIPPKKTTNNIKPHQKNYKKKLFLNGYEKNRFRK